MKKETKEYVRTFGIALLVMMTIPLAYRVCIYFWPPEEKPRKTLALSNSIASSREKSIMCEKACEICDESKRLIEGESLQDEVLKRALVENLKGARQ